MQTSTPSNFTLADGAGHTFFERQAELLECLPDQPDARRDRMGRQQPRAQLLDRPSGRSATRARIASYSGASFGVM